MSDEYVPQPWRMEGYYPDQYAKTSASLDFALDYDDETFDRYEREFLADLKAYVAAQQVLALREAAERAWDEGFTRGFYSGQSMRSDADASESPVENPYRADRIRAERERVDLLDPRWGWSDE